MALVPGSIAFIGYNADGNDGFAFIVLDTIDPGQVIYFSDNEWDGSAFNTGEGGFSWTNGATALAAGTVVEFLNTSATKAVNIGTVSAGSIALGNSGESIFAFTGSSLTAPTTFLAAVTNNNGGFTGATTSGLLTNTGLTAGVTALVLPGTTGADVAVYNPATAGFAFATRADALAAFNNAANFVVQDASGDQDADNVTPDAPFTTDPQSPIAGVTFTIGAQPQAQTVAFSAGSVSVSQAEGNTGTTSFTFTVERTGGTDGDISFSGQLSSAATDAADFSGPVAVPFVFSGTIPAGQTSAVVVVQVAGDAVVEANEAFTLTLQTVSNNNAAVTASLGAQANATGTIQNDDAAGPGNVINGITILDEAASLAGATATPAATNAVQLIRLDNFTPSAGTNAEVVTFDATTDRAFVLNTIGNKIDIVGISASGATSAVGSIDLTVLEDFGGANSVAVKNGVLAVAVASAPPGSGFVALFDSNGVLIKTIEVGAGPDQVVFTADGSKLLVANEGEPFTVGANVVNPEGSVSIISLAGGAANATLATTVEFDALNGFENLLKQAGVSVLTGQGAAADIEPEYITVSPDGSRAYVTLQEVNAVAVIDLTDPAATKPIAILPLGGVDHNLAGNAFDGSDRDGTANLRTADVIGLLQPDAIASYSVGNTTYFITANEGDARVNLDDEANLAELTLDPTAYANAAALQDNTTGLGRLRVRQDLGDTDGDGDIDQIYAYGGRGISIFKQNADGTITKVRETGGEFEAIIARDFAARFNIDTAEGGGGGATDNRSDNKGPEPEGVDIGVINGRTYAFVGLERVGGVMIYDVTDPANATYVGYRPPLTGEGNAPEVTKFISATDSPTGTALVLTANEGNSTAGFAGSGLTVYAALPQDYAQEIRVASSSTSVSQVEGNAGTTTFTFTIERTNGTIGSVDVTLQLAAGASNGANAQDFAGGINLPGNVTVTIPAGQASATVTINVAGDTAFEANENFTVTITCATTAQEGVTAAVSATQAVATGTIQNDDLLHIYDVQGAGRRSEYVGQQVTVRGIVTAIDASGTENGGNNPVGYYIQDAVGDGDYRTSDGVFVFLGTGAGVTIPNGIVVGAEVQLTATVNEFASTNQLSVTQLNPVAGMTSVLSTGNALPTAVRIGDVDNLATGLERTGTGDIDIRVGRDLQLAHYESVIYTAGRKDMTTWADFSTAPANAAYGVLGGHLDIVAGGNVSSAPPADAKQNQLFTEWLKRQGETDKSYVFTPVTGSGASTGPQSSWWVDYSAFSQGVGALGGGNVAINAGGDLVNLLVALPTNGRLRGGRTAAEQKILEVRNGGAMSVEAAGALRAGYYYVGRGAGTITAGEMTTGRNVVITRNATTKDVFAIAPVLALGDATLSVKTFGDLRLQTVLDPLLLATGKREQGAAFMSGYTDRTLLELTSVGGDVVLVNQAQFLSKDLDLTNPQQGADVPYALLAQLAGNLYPSMTRMTALNGSVVNQNRFFTMPGRTPELRILAEKEVLTGAIVMSRATPEMIPSPFRPVGGGGSWIQLSMAGQADVAFQAQGFQDLLVNAIVPSAYYSPQPNHNTYLRSVSNPAHLLNENDYEPSRIYALSGSIIGNNIPYYRAVPAPGSITANEQTWFRAGTDIRNITYALRNLHGTDVSLLEAGNDIIGGARLGNIRIEGPGALVVSAGRDVYAPELQIYSAGNQQYEANNRAKLNTQILGLPEQGAAITVMAGLKGKQPSYDAFLAAYLDPANVAAMPDYLKTTLPDGTVLPLYLTDLTDTRPSGTVKVVRHGLVSFMKEVTGATLSPLDAWARFQALPQVTQERFVRQVYLQELREAGTDQNMPGVNGLPRNGGYNRGYAAIETLFPGNDWKGDVAIGNALFRTMAGGDIDVLTPGGGLQVAALGTAPEPKYGLITMGYGNINIFARNNVTVNRSRVLTFAGGDEIVWSTLGDIDAGRGAKTTRVPSAPDIVTDVNAVTKALENADIAGSGIGTVIGFTGVEEGDVHLIAPEGTVNAGDAGVRVSGNFTLAARFVLNVDNIQVGGKSIGVPKAEAKIAPLTVDTKDKAAADAVKDVTAQAPSNRPSVIIVEVLGYGGGDGGSNRQEEDEGRARDQRSYNPNSAVQYVGAGLLNDEQRRQVVGEGGAGSRAVVP